MTPLPKSSPLVIKSHTTLGTAVLWRDFAVVIKSLGQVNFRQKWFGRPKYRKPLKGIWKGSQRHLKPEKGSIIYHGYFEDWGGGSCEKEWVALKLRGSQQGVRDLDPTTTRNWIMQTTRPSFFSGASRLEPSRTDTLIFAWWDSKQRIHLHWPGFLT